MSDARATTDEWGTVPFRSLSDADRKLAIAEVEAELRSAISLSAETIRLSADRNAALDVEIAGLRRQLADAQRRLSESQAETRGLKGTTDSRLTRCGGYISTDAKHHADLKAGLLYLADGDVCELGYLMRERRQPPQDLLDRIARHAKEAPR